MKISDLVTDAYERKARLYPALLLIAPIIATGVAIASAKLSILQSIGTAAVGCGGAFLLTQLARDAGRNREKMLFEKWGGMPSVAIFRHRDEWIDPITKGRYHKKLTALVKEAKAPTVEEENVNPAMADKIYTAWSNYLRVNTRDTKKFALLFRENINYGYRRNVWGLRPLGIVISGASCLIALARLLTYYKVTGQIDQATAGAAAFDLVLFFLWVFLFCASWVRIPAEAYAARLAETSETLAIRPAS
jgi:hypothetical protein